MTTFLTRTHTFGLVSLMGLAVGCDELQLAELELDSAARMVEPMNEDGRQTEYDAEILAIWLEGSFVSTPDDESMPEDAEPQSLLAVCALEQSDRTAELMYLEQRALNGANRFIGQKLYAISETDTGVELTNYLMRPEEGLRLRGACNNPGAVKVDSSLIAIADDCAVPMSQNGKDRFGGSTVAMACPSDRRGTSMETLSIVVEPLMIDFWSRGYDETGAQIWGPANGPVRYRRIR